MCNRPVQEDYLLENGEGLIEVRGDGFDCGLLVEGKPVAFCWSDCEGSIAQYLVRSRDTTNLSERLRVMRQVADGGLDLDMSLAEQIRPLLNLFTSGQYRIHYDPSLQHYQVQTYDSRFSYAQDRDWFYPDIPVLVMTQSSTSLRSDRIRYFRERISSGARPVVFTASVEGGMCSFVLDGHHKLQAYQELHTSPAIMIISRQQAGPNLPQEGIQLLGEAQQYSKEYCRVKRYQGILNEEGWVTCTNLVWLLKYVGVRQRASNRKLRLFLCAVCQQVCQRLANDRAKRAVEVAERYAEGLASEAELARVHQAALAAQAGGVGHGRRASLRSLVVNATSSPVNPVAYPATYPQISLGLLRDIIGNPFRSIAVNPSWLAWSDSTVVKIAQAIYNERRFGDLPILADALEDAGCDNEDILRHCREPGNHVLGCWVVDLLLGKS